MTVPDIQDGSQVESDVENGSTPEADFEMDDAPMEDHSLEKNSVQEDAPSSADSSLGKLEAVDEAVVKDTDAEDSQHGRCYAWMTRMRLGWFARFPDAWPRTFAILFGVIAPVLLLIPIALVFGFLLADLEAPQEVEANNDVIANRALVAFTQDFYRNVTVEVPTICLSLAFRNQSTEESVDAALREALAQVYLEDRHPFNQTAEQNEILVNETNAQSLVDFMQDCGARAWELTAQILTWSDVTISDLGSLSFHWIQCLDDQAINASAFNQIMGNFLRTPQSNLTRLRPDVQETLAVDAWANSQRSLFDQYQQEIVMEGMSTEERANAVFEARQRAFEDADGFGSCVENSAAGAWFWFTVMTTIGYGNTAPVTTGGRAMVYTLGFLSILVFAGVLGNAGRIVSAIFDDWFDRAKVPFLHLTWAACLMWGFLYYGWMFMIALYTHGWKETRLGEEFTFRDAYWFSFISTTTVGLGDFFLEHQVLLRRDLVVFSLLFLVGFIFLANFLVKLTEVIGSLFKHKHRNLDDALKTTDMLWHPKKKNLHASTPAEPGADALSETE